MAHQKSSDRRSRIARMTIITACALAATPLTAGKPDPDYKYGPEPKLEDYRERIEARIRGSMVDPDSARISLTRGFWKGWAHPFLEYQINGYTTCGYVNAKNRMGGYAGNTSFIVVIDYGHIVYSAVGKTSGLDWVSEACADGTRKGLFPRLPDPGERRDIPVATTGGGFDFATSLVPDGAYVKFVVPNGLAEKAGLKPGMVIAELNGMSLKGMDAQMTEKLFTAVTSEATLTIIGMGPIKLRKPPPTPNAFDLLPKDY